MDDSTIKTAFVGAAFAAGLGLAGRVILQEWREHQQKSGTKDVLNWDFPVISTAQGFRKEFRKSRKDFMDSRPKILKK